MSLNFSKRFNSSQSKNFNKLSITNIPRNSQIAIYGAGRTGKFLFKKIKANISCFIEEPTSVNGREVHGLPVLSESEAYNQFGSDLFVIIAIFSPNFNSLKLERRLNNNYGWHSISFAKALLQSKTRFAFYYLTDLSRQPQISSYTNLYDSLGDTKSKKLLLSNIISRQTGIFDQGVSKRSNFKFLKLNCLHNLTYIDCGAYTGDTLIFFLEACNLKFKKIIAVEPDTVNFLNLISFIKSLPLDIVDKISALNCAISDKTGSIAFKGSGSMSSRIHGKGKNIVKSIKLNEFQKLDGPVMFKLDIEGFEYSSLLSCKNFLKKSRPILAVSVYHKPLDLLNVYTLINNSLKEYVYYLRQYGGSGSDLMLFCVPNERQF